MHPTVGHIQCVLYLELRTNQIRAYLVNMHLIVGLGKLCHHNFKHTIYSTNSTEAYSSIISAFSEHNTIPFLLELLMSKITRLVLDKVKAHTVFLASSLSTHSLPLCCIIVKHVLWVEGQLPVPLHNCA